MTGSDIQIDRGGFVRIHHAILERLAMTELTGRESRILFALLRLTYGFNKKEDAISLAQFCELTRMKKNHVIDTLRGLVDRHIVNRTGGSRGRGHVAVYGFNKYHEQWLESTEAEEKVPLNVLMEVPFDEEEKVPQTANKRYPKRPIKGTPDHEHTKDSKDIKTIAAAAVFVPVIDETFGAFVRAFEHCWALPLSGDDQDRVHEWCAKIPIEAWEYALRETKDVAGVGKWKYLEKILLRVQTEGIGPSPNGKPSRAELATFNGQMAAKEAALATRAKIERDAQRTAEKYGKRSDPVRGTIANGR